MAAPAGSFRHSPHNCDNYDTLHRGNETSQYGKMIIERHFRFKKELLND